MGVRSWPNQIKAIRMMERTGVEAITTKRGRMKALKCRSRAAGMPTTRESGITMATLKRMRRKLIPRASRKRRVTKRLRRVTKVFQGFGSKRSLPRARLPNSQRRSSARIPKRTHSVSLLFIKASHIQIEVVRGKFPPDRLGGVLQESPIKRFQGGPGL